MIQKIGNFKFPSLWTWKFGGHRAVELVQRVLPAQCRLMEWGGAQCFNVGAVVAPEGVEQLGARRLFRQQKCHNTGELDHAFQAVQLRIGKRLRCQRTVIGFNVLKEEFYTKKLIIRN